MANLRLTASEFTVHLYERLGFEATTEQVVDGLDFGAEFLDFPASLKKCVTGNEATDVGHFLGGCNDLGRDGFSQFSFFSEVTRRHDRQRKQFFKSGFAEFFSGCRAHARQVFYGQLDLLFLRHRRCFFFLRCFILFNFDVDFLF